MQIPTDDNPVVVWEGDCLDLLPRIPSSASIVSDPPYGIKYDASASSQKGIQKFKAIHGDDELFDPSPLLGFRDCILWGVNNYCHAIPPLKGQWYFWDKVTRNDLDVRIAEGEFAWHKLGTKPRAFRHLWSGAYRASEQSDRSLHPTQKPVALMRWCIQKANVPPGSLVCDPYCGSGTTGVAAALEGRKCILIEKDPHYAAIARRRVAEVLGQNGLFRDMKPAPSADLFAVAGG